MKNRALLCFAAGLLALVSSGIALAQSTTATILGTVKDSSGAVLPQTQVVVLNEDTGISRTVQADGEGRYSALSLGSGNYRVTASHDGFQTVSRSGIVLTVGREAVVDLALAVGTTTQTLEVTGEAPLVEATSASLSSLVDTRSIRALPLNGRSYDQLALLQPGVLLTSPGQTGGAPFAYGTSSRFTVGGQRSTSNNFLLDGTNINDQGNGTPGGAAGTNLGVDTILEFKIFTNSFKAEFGHSTGGVVTAITRSGANALHGTLFEYIRNSALDARNFFDVRNSPAPFKRNQFGGVVGGKIKKDKTFFFGGYEGLRQRLASNLAAIVPTAEARRGILPVAVGSSATITVPVNPVMVPYLNLYPLPNGRIFGDGTGQYLSAPSTPTNEDNVMGRIDHHFNEKHNIFGRYTFDNDSVNAQSSMPNVFLKQTSRRQYSTIQVSSILSPRALNNFRFAVNRTNSKYLPIVDPPVAAGLELIPGLPLGALAVGALNAVSSSQSLTQLGSPSVGSGNRLWAFTVFQWGDDFSYTVGKHSFKAGVDLQRVRDNAASGNFQRGGYTFASLNTFLAGTPSNLQASAPLGVLPQWGLRQSLIGLYAQDDYTLSSRITLNLGLRWEATTDPKDAKNQMSILPSLNAPAMVKSDKWFSTGKKNFEPRVGIAWRVNESGKTVVRVGAGIYHNQILPWAYALNVSNPPFYGRYSANNPPFPDGYKILQPGLPLTVSVYTPLEKTPTDYQYNFSLQQQVSKSTVVQLSYAGNHGSHLQTERELDTATPVFTNGDYKNPFYPAGAPRINPNFSGVLMLENNGNSSYNSMTITAKRQSANGFEGQVFYTWAKAMDINSGISQSDSVRTPQVVMNPYDLGRDHARSDFDVRHAAVANFLYPVPFKSASRALGMVANGWTLNGVTTFSSGMPFTLRLANAQSRSLAAFTADRPNLIPNGNQNPTSGVSAGCNGFAAGTPVGTPTNWYDPCNFVFSAAGTYGNLGRNTVQGPGVASVDMGLEKKFALTETKALSFRMEMFNVLNHANFGLPSATPLAASGAASPSAGLITYTTTSSRQIQFALRINF